MQPPFLYILYFNLKLSKKQLVYKKAAEFVIQPPNLTLNYKMISSYGVGNFACGEGKILKHSYAYVLTFLHRYRRNYHSRAETFRFKGHLVIQDY